MSLFKKRALVEDLDPVKLEEQKQRVQEIRKTTDEFEYGHESDEENPKG